MELHPIQNQALENILHSYSVGRNSVLLVMPAGTGKTVLALYAIKRLASDFKIKSIAYIASTKALESAVERMVQESVDTSEKITQVYIPSELVRLIEAKKLNSKSFEVIIFDDISEFDQQAIKKIFDYFDCFKIGFSRNDLGNKSRIFNSNETNTIFKYSLNDAVNEGYFLSSQRALYRHFFNNFYHQLNTIKIGTDWSQAIKERLIQQLDFIEGENSEYLKAQELIISGKINIAEILELSHKKEQLEEFERMLNDEKYFIDKQKDYAGAEAVWQKYFESNPWIFGFGLNYIFNTPLEGKKLEQVVEGYSIVGRGKRTDALLKTTGLVQTLCFGEIKTHQKSILKETLTPYRPESWAISDELAGGISQIHKTVQKSLKNISTALSVFDEDGFKLRHPIYLYKPKSFLIIGSLKEFKNENGDIHEEKFSSFELFRRSISDIEIITFDELYERANAIVRKRWK